ncbi:hypothetical protein QE152_g29332 [Popillia japonica]|uniref:Uncharacterized protein n=1 Tax=Popillia japonica TaxID=7064 RepID=A0AAW1JHY8_POPJA
MAPYVPFGGRGVTVWDGISHTCHLEDNYSITFKDPETGAHTNSIESSWRAAKSLSVLLELLFKFVIIIDYAFNTIATIEKGVQAFQVTGIFPFNRFGFSDEELTPLPDGVERTTAKNANPTIRRIERTPSPVARPSTSICRFLLKVIQTKSKQNRESLSDSDISDLILEEATEDELSYDNDKTLQPKQANKSFTDLLPLPKSKIKGMPRRTQHSKIMSSTPVKDELDKKRREKEGQAARCEKSQEKCSFWPKTEKKNTATTETCSVCYNFGGNNYLWWRCRSCGSWAHAD